MADANYARFADRLNRIDQSHRRLSRGYVRLIERDGMLVPVPQRRRIRRGFPFRGLLLTIAGFLAFKGVLFAHLGAGTYEYRVGAIADGSAIERVAAWVMQADPITIWIAGQVAPLL